MSKITLEPNSSGAGTFSIVSPDSNINRTLTLPDESGTILNDQSILDGTNIDSVDSAKLTGDIEKARLENEFGLEFDHRVFGRITKNGGSTTWTKICELPDAGNSDCGIILTAAGTSDFGSSSTVGYHLVNFTTRRGPTVTKTQLGPTDRDETTWAYIDDSDSSSGLNELWVRRGSFTYQTILVIYNNNSSLSRDLTLDGTKLFGPITYPKQTSEPSSIVYS